MSFETEMKDALMECALIISSFRNKNATAGHPLREPPGVSAIIAQIDALLDPENQPKKIRTEATKQAPKPKFERIAVISRPHA